MKYVILVLVVLAVLWWLKQSRGSSATRGTSAKRSPSGTEPMISCAHCGVHLPRREAVAGVEAFYCSEAHRLADGD